MKLSLIAICAVAYPAAAYIWAQILFNNNNTITIIEEETTEETEV